MHVFDKTIAGIIKHLSEKDCQNGKRLAKSCFVISPGLRKRHNTGWFPCTQNDFPTDAIAKETFQSDPIRRKIILSGNPSFSVCRNV